MTYQEMKSHVATFQPASIRHAPLLRQQQFLAGDPPPPLSLGQTAIAREAANFPDWYVQWRGGSCQSLTNLSLTLPNVPLTNACPVAGWCTSQARYSVVHLAAIGSVSSPPTTVGS